MLTKGLSGDDILHLKSAIDEAAIVAMTDAKGIITYVNDKFCAISKYSKSELLGQNHRIINSGYHDKQFFQNMWQTICQGKVWEAEIRNQAKDGSHYWVHTTIVPFLGESGKPERYVSVRYEITEMKENQEKLAIYAKRLEASNRELQDFASVAAHDLQEPLRKLQAFSDRLKSKAKDVLSAETFEYVDRIQSSAERMQRLINDLLSYSRVTTKGKPFAKIAFKDILAPVVSDLEVRIEQTGGSVEWQDDIPNFEADPIQMQQLFLNLVGNALKFKRPDVPPKVYISGRRIGDHVEIQVNDNGIGFDAKYAERIFTIFQRLHGRHEYEGTGIGLAICRKIVERHGGTIEAQSLKGEGSTFKIVLPLKQATGGE